jgi:dynein heavy chain
MFAPFLPLQVDSLLREVNTVPAGEDPGPATELEYWRKQMARINSLTEQLKRRECKLVLGVCSVAHSPVSAAPVHHPGCW